MKKILLIFLLSLGISYPDIYLDNINSDDYPEIRAEVFVSDGGEARLPLLDSDLIIFEGISQIDEITILTDDLEKNETANLLLVIESTASISSLEYRLIQRILDDLILKFDKKSEIGITTFNNYSFLLSERTDDENKLRNSLDFLLPNGIGTLNTAFLSETINSIDIAKDSNSDIIFISDGDIAGNTSAIISRAKSAGVSISPLVLGFQSNEQLDEIAEQTGGYVYENVTDNNYEQICGAVMSRSIYKNPSRISWQSSFCNSPAIGNIVHIPTASGFDFDYEFPETARNLEFLPNQVVQIPFVKAGETYFEDITIFAFNSDFEITDIEYDCPSFKISNFPTGKLNSQTIYKIELEYEAQDEEYRICEFTVKTTECNDIKFFVEVGRKDDGILNKQITVNYPNGGEIFFPGEEIEVEWSNSSPLDTFDIEIREDDDPWVFLENVKTGNIAEIRLPQKTDDNYRIRVSQFSGNDILNGVKYLDLEGKIAREYGWNKDGNILAVYTDASEIEIWNPENEELIGVQGGSSVIEAFGLKWSKVTNRFAIINNFGTKDLVLFDGTLQNLPVKLNGDGSELTSLSWKGDDSRIAASNNEGDLLIYDTESTNLIEKLNDISNNSIINIEYHPNENWIFYTDDLGNISVIDLDTDKKQLIRNEGFSEADFKISETGDSLLIFSKFSGYSLYRTTQNSDGDFLVEFLLSEDLNLFEALDWSANSEAIIVSRDNLIDILDEKELDTIYTFSGHSNLIKQIKYKNELVASYTGGRFIQVWNINEDHSPFIFQRDESDRDFKIVPVSVTPFDIELGDICKGFDNDTIIKIGFLNNSQKEITIDRIFIRNDPGGNFSRPLETESVVASNSNGSIRILASPKEAGSIQANYVIDTQGELFEGKITANVIEPKFEASREILDLGDVNLREAVNIKFDIVKNISDELGIIDSAKIFFPEKIFSLPFGEVESGEILSYEGEFEFDLIGPKTGLTRVFTQDNCTPIQIPVTVNVVAPNLILASTKELKLLDCESRATDTIFVRNSGGGLLRLESANSNNPNVTLKIIDDEAIAGANARIEIDYSLLGPGSDSVSISLKSNLKEDLRTTTDLKVYFNRVDTRFFTNQTEFLFVSPNSPQELNVQNIGDRTLNIEIPTSDDFNIVFDKTMLLPGEQTKINISANPLGGPIQDRISSTTINLIGFCENREIELMADYTDLLPVLSAVEEVIFDTRQCFNGISDTTITITNEGNAELEINNIRIEGVQSANFEILDDSDLLLNPNTSADIFIRFDPQNESFQNDVVLFAETNSTQNGGVFELPIQINNLISGFDVDLNNVIENNLDFNTEKTFELEIENLGNLPSSLSPTLIGDNFLIDSISNNPADSGESSIIYLRFIGGKIDEQYRASLIFTDDCGSQYTKTYEINVIGTRNFEISIREYTGRPGDELSIPITVSNRFGSALPNDGSYSATVSFNSSMLYTSGTFTGISEKKRWVESKGNLLDELNGNSQNRIDLLVALGNSEITDLEINAEFENSGAYNFISENGSFAYDAEYLLNFPGLVDGTQKIDFKGPVPNPVVSFFNVSFNMIENGNCRLEIIDYNGRKIRTILNEELQTGLKEYSFNSLELSSGYYFLFFKTQTYEKLVPFTVVN